MLLDDCRHGGCDRGRSGGGHVSWLTSPLCSTVPAVPGIFLLCERTDS